VVAALVTAVVLLAACGSGDDSAPVPTTEAPSTTASDRPRSTTTLAATTTAAPVTVPPVVVPDLGVPTFTAARLIGPDFVAPELDDAARAGIGQLLGDYARRAMAIPLGTSAPAELDGLMSSVLAPRITPEQRAVLTDEGVPRLVNVHVDHFNVEADGLAGPDGLVALVNGRIEISVSGLTADGGQPVTIARRGDLTFVWEPDAAGGGWRLDSFALDVDRALPA